MNVGRLSRITIRKKFSTFIDFMENAFLINRNVGEANEGSSDTFAATSAAEGSMRVNTKNGHAQM